jgi:hypothetical protein
LGLNGIFNTSLIKLKNPKNLYTILIYNNFVSINLALPSNKCNLEFDKNTKVLSLGFLVVNNYYKTYFSYINEVLNIPFRPKFTRVKFKGKGYYVYRSVSNIISPQFGYSHRLYLYSILSTFALMSKSSLVFFGLTSNYAHITALRFRHLRPLNIFTGRGVRLSRQLVDSKPGKISTYR